MLFAFSAAESRIDRVVAITAVASSRIDSASLSKWHDLLGSEPHVAGTPGDVREIERIAAAFTAMGLEVEIDTFYPYLSHPTSALVEIVESSADAPLPVSPDASRPRRGVLALDLREKNLAEDPSTAHPGLTFGWNAYSGSGDTTGEVVYANYGLKEDFARLKALGVECENKVVLIRYGKAFRAQKARNAEFAGASAVLLFTEPAESGSGKGLVYPDGGWANATCIQRGTVNALPYPGDPLTPGLPATKDAPRIPTQSVELPMIPVQPIGYGAASEIMGRMRGAVVPDESWQGGMSMAYRLTGGSELRVRVKIEQRREISESANVIAKLRGTGVAQGTDTVIVGCHHDAWGFGAADPLAGTIVLMETARVFAAMAKDGLKLDRDILFCAWGAEEYGIIGSTEWVEARTPWLIQHAEGYINLDMAAMGTRLSASASPSVAHAVRDAASRVVGVDATQTALAEVEATGGAGSFIAGPIGGGSDQVAFVCFAGIPSVALGSHGSEGTSYHSNYDTVEWYRRIVGSDYAGASLVSRVCVALIADLAAGPTSTRRASPIIEVAAGEIERLHSLVSANANLAAIGALAEWSEARAALASSLEAAKRCDLAGGEEVRQFESMWISEEGLPDRPWYRSLFTASDRNDGYGVVLLPALAEAVVDKDSAAVSSALKSIVTAVKVR